MSFYVSASSLAHKAYAPSSGSVRTLRSTEFEVLARITHRIKAAILKDDFNSLVSALQENRLLWNAFAADVATPDNKLDKDIRAQIFYLAEFTGIQTQKILSGKANAKSLLEINAIILSGMKSEGGD